MKSGSKYSDFGHILGGICLCMHSLVNLDFFHKLLYYSPKNNFFTRCVEPGMRDEGEKENEHFACTESCKSGAGMVLAFRIRRGVLNLRG